jgi:outer membrane protein OmpA-like peptidoglycan-associated protein
MMFGGALALAVAVSVTARAQERNEPYLAQHLRAPSNRLELTVGTGYTQGVGTLAPNRDMRDVMGAGIGASAQIDYRLSPPWSIGIEAQYQEFGAEQNSAVRGFAGNLGVTYHFMPMLRGDAWARVGTGYRLLWEYDPPGLQGQQVMRHGFDLLTAKVGYDVRVSEDVAIAPVVGADVSTFIYEQPSNGRDEAMSSAQTAVFFWAGLQGRFDIGGSRGGLPVVAQRLVNEPKGVTAPQPESAIAPLPALEELKPTTPSLAISEDILRACQVNLGAIDKAPKFDFDKSTLLPADTAVLDQVADCFITGPLKDAALHLVGRADPRGTVAYTDALGMNRAKAVAAYLERLGVSADRIELTSRGKRDARGQGEATWAIDRRVDILQSQ